MQKISKRSKRIAVAVFIVICIILAGILIWRDGRKYSDDFCIVIIKAEDGVNYTLSFPLPRYDREGKDIHGTPVKFYPSLEVKGCYYYYLYRNSTGEWETSFYFSDREVDVSYEEIVVKEDCIEINSNRSFLIRIRADFTASGKFDPFGKSISIECDSEGKMEFALICAAKFRRKSDGDGGSLYYHKYEGVVNNDFKYPENRNYPDFCMLVRTEEYEFFDREPWVELSNGNNDVKVTSGKLVLSYPMT